MTTRPVVVLGLMGAGKSTFARALAARTGRHLRDSDVDIERGTGHTAAQIAAESPERLHDLEAAQLCDALADPDVVAAAAASTVDRADLRAAMRGAFVVWLDAPTDVLVRRFGSRAHRPRFHTDVATLLAEQRERRSPWLAELATVRLDATRPVADLVADVVARLDSPA